MKNFIVGLTFIAVVVAGIGLWRGWFIVDRERIEDDTNRAIEKVKDTSKNILKKSESD